MSRSVNSPPVVVYEEHVAGATYEDREMLSSYGVTTFETVNNEALNEEHLLSSGLKPSELIFSNDHDDVAVAVQSSLKQRELLPQGKPFLQRSIESIQRGSCQRQLSSSCERKCSSPSYFMYPIDPHPVCEKSVSNKKDVTNLTCKCPYIPPVNLDTLDQADLTTKETADAQEGKYSTEFSTGQSISAIIHLVPQTTNGTTKSTVSSTQDIRTQKSRTSFNKGVEKENSFLLPYQAPRELTERKEETSFSYPPSLEGGSKHDVQSSLMSIASNTFGFFLPEAVLGHRNFDSTFGSFYVADRGNSDNTQFLFHTGSNGSTNGKINFHHPCFDRELSSLSRPGMENIQREMNSMWHVGGTQFYNPARIIRYRTNSSQRTESEDQSKELMRSSSYPNLTDEGSKPLSSHWSCLPQFASAVDAAELVGGGDRNLSNSTTFIVPILGTFPSEGDEGVAMGNSQDSRTLGSLSWFAP
ncbi:hypothetical protein LSM04_001321 [Trypanosoma melophagium]|uniref:uncharacterized protein n=1 Tax=Trypanosoma melophagium TaxID=715481 RepID=UPI00351A3267|nr:hypothetical protein LSM04_001321 [Trypanosoma melophagium]